LLLVSHDRAFLDNVVTSVFVLDGTGKIEEYVGGYSDWMQQRREPEQKAQAVKKTPEKEKAEKPAAAKKKKLSYKEQQELNQLPERIEQLETRQAELNEQINSSEFYKNDQADITRMLDELSQTVAKLEQAYQRWNELEEMASESN
jgi:ATP-binding cassette subfamily F protein uup